MIKEIAPVVIFIYKRENKFRRLIDTLRPLKPKKLFVVADGPKNNADLFIINKTRGVLKEVDWDTEILTNFSEKNMGADLRVPTGLDWVFDNVEKCIMLEDDRIVDESFFHFATYILNKYENDQRIGYVAGNTPVTLNNLKGDYFFSRFYFLPTFGTWRRVWKNRVRNYQEINDEDYKKNIYKILKNKRFAETKIKSYEKQKYQTNPPIWDFMWGVYCGMNNLLAVYHKNNLSQNDGNDEYAFHPGQMLPFIDFFKKAPPIKKVEFPIIDPPEVTENYEFIKQINKKKYALIPFLYEKILGRIYWLLKKLRIINIRL
tara:strand:+ start:3435 stop:4385 length:951 start_codon:yes stop_codon:yes gene_type:complete